MDDTKGTRDFDEEKSVVDETNKSILRLLRDNGRMSFTEIGEELGISRVAVQKRVKKLEEEGILRGYRAVIYREDLVKMFMEITTVDAECEDLLEYLGTTAYIKEVYLLTNKSSAGASNAKNVRILVVAEAPAVSELKYLTRMVQKKFEHSIKTITCHGVTERIKDVNGGVDYDRAKRERNKRNE